MNTCCQAVEQQPGIDLPILHRKMDLSALSTRLFPLTRRKRWKGSTPPLTWGAIRDSLEVLNAGADFCGPFKSATGAVIALCNIVDRVAACDSKTEQLAFRAVTLLDTIYNAIPEQETIPSHLIPSIAQFELVVNEILVELKCGTASTNRMMRALRLRCTESKLAEFMERLDATAEAFTVKNMTLHTMSLVRIEAKVETISTALEHSNTLLHDQIKYLQLTVVFLA
ncbi:hypothetical protein R3P38DRAFT_2965842 [Favolaschia claudopus]|uniref:Uncharacterized protein n=1 Tax=Favolaschia claudopus TaxID=2862362 RepID=A0AAW0B5V7_9AGAR